MKGILISFLFFLVSEKANFLIGLIGFTCVAPEGQYSIVLGSDVQYKSYYISIICNTHRIPALSPVNTALPFIWTEQKSIHVLDKCFLG